MKNNLKIVLFFEKCFAFCGSGAIFVLFLQLYKKSIKLVAIFFR